MNNKIRNTALGLGAVVIATSSGLGTYALWSDSATVDGGQITSGNLNIEALSTVAQDVSPDRADSPHAVDLTTWRAVPGDVVSMTTGFDVALEGDNIQAVLNTDVLDAAIGPDAAQYVTYNIELTDAAGNIITKNPDGVYEVKAGRAGQDAGQDINEGLVVPANLDGTSDVTAKVTVTFDDETPERVLTQSNLAGLSNGAVTLQQVR